MDKKVEDTEIKSDEKNLDAASIVERTTIADVYRADKQLAGIVKKTKLIQSDFFSEQCGNRFTLSRKICNTPALSNCAAHTIKSANLPTKKKLKVLSRHQQVTTRRA